MPRRNGNATKGGRPKRNKHKRKPGLPRNTRLHQNARITGERGTPQHGAAPGLHRVADERDEAAMKRFSRNNRSDTHTRRTIGSNQQNRNGG